MVLCMCANFDICAEYLSHVINAWSMKYNVVSQSKKYGSTKMKINQRTYKGIMAHNIRAYAVFLYANCMKNITCKWSEGKQK